ncbi:unnamed protein product [Prorocentrum cordatum]|uniref:Nudix hydrolase domain-containing protein n=1 Tax=Prorocentrum cordatum TaxID=2364126 RepID=A0ABN9VKA5_9DINO|nr:unnamed protein product [Polarella glacialis]
MTAACPALPQEAAADGDPAANKRHRLVAAAAAVLDSSGRLLVREHPGQPGAWVCPQGGVGAEESSAESVAGAAARALLESTGLTEAHVVPAAAQGADEGDGAAERQLRWALFFVADAHLDADPARTCRPREAGGGAGEALAAPCGVRWAPLDGVVAQAREEERALHARLQEWARPLLRQRGEGCAALDFSGTWTRTSAARAAKGVVAGLLARGQSAEDAARKAASPYVQLWERSPEDPLHWVVTTYKADGVTPRRKLLYPTGEWDEEWGHEGAPNGHTAPSTIFGAACGKVRRRTVYLAERACRRAGWAHSTLTRTPLGEEESPPVPGGREDDSAPQLLELQGSAGLVADDLRGGVRAPVTAGRSAGARRRRTLGPWRFAGWAFSLGFRPRRPRACQARPRRPPWRSLCAGGGGAQR